MHRWHFHGVSSLPAHTGLPSFCRTWFFIIVLITTQQVIMEDKSYKLNKDLWFVFPLVRIWIWSILHSLVYLITGSLLLVPFGEAMEPLQVGIGWRKRISKKSVEVYSPTLFPNSSLLPGQQRHEQAAWCFYRWGLELFLLPCLPTLRDCTSKPEPNPFLLVFGHSNEEPIEL